MSANNNAVSMPDIEVEQVSFSEDQLDASSTWIPVDMSFLDDSIPASSVDEQGSAPTLKPLSFERVSYSEVAASFKQITTTIPTNDEANGGMDKANVLNRSVSVAKSDEHVHRFDMDTWLRNRATHVDDHTDNSAQQNNNDSTRCWCLVFKTKPCRYVIRKEECAFGKSCRFAHSLEELSTDPLCRCESEQYQPRVKAPTIAPSKSQDRYALGENHSEEALHKYAPFDRSLQWERRISSDVPTFAAVEVVATPASIWSPSIPHDTTIQHLNMQSRVRRPLLSHKKLIKVMYKTKICRNYWQFGICPFGVSCRFAHGQRDIRLVADEELTTEEPLALASVPQHQLQQQQQQQKRSTFTRSSKVFENGLSLHHRLYSQHQSNDVV